MERESYVKCLEKCEIAFLVFAREIFGWQAGSVEVVRGSARRLLCVQCERYFVNMLNEDEDKL